MSRKRQKEKPDKANAEDEKNTGATPIEKLPAQTFDEYQCSGHVEVDFHWLCTLLDMKDIPAVSTKPPSSPTETEGGDKEDSQLESNAEPCWSKPCLQVELEEEDPLSAKYLKVSGWKVDERIARVLQKMLLSLSKLQSLHFWQAGLTDPMVISLVNTISLCSNLRDVTLEGNHLPEQSYHLLLCEDSVLTHLSLRNNRIGDEGARLIGSALSTTRSANKNLVSLNLAFNAIGDAGATHIAQGLRLNRALLVLSLSNNQIGDSGAAHLAEILVEFPLTHEEVVDRRKMLLERTQTSSLRVDGEQPADQLPLVASSSSLSKGKKKEASKKEDNPTANKENPKSNKKSSDVKVSQSKGAKQSGKEKQLAAQEDKSNTALNEQQVECEEVENPLLDQSVQHRDGEIILPGNTTLSSLNLAEKQGEGGGLLRLCLQRNRFPEDCECYVKIKELMTLTA
ncbi:Leucine-rich repeat-containing protein 71 [Dissostichus eleginoides]|uniref:Leucine-rich repeat-containing protein 71 n=1 Tax=Dissostichus eleginoides TaxID=100907 RepID=A0AAD9B9W9_DISEL|nr:Leucine-rich repeat-containing protein 71 [Dissostichus eleginoides]